MLIPARSKTLLRDRLRAILEMYAEESQLDGITKVLVGKIAGNFLKNTSDEDIRKIILHLRDEVIPTLLEEEINENQNQ